MKWSNSEDFFPISEFLRCELNDDRTDLEDVDSGDNNENSECICHHSHDSEIGSERERSYVTHVKLRGFYVEPEKCYECPDDEHANCREDKESVSVGYKGVDNIIEEEESTCKPIKSISYIDRIGHGDDDKYKERNIERPKADISDKREVESGMTELDIEPVCSDPCKYHKKYHFYTSREPLGSTNPANIQIIIYESYEPNSSKSEECEVGFISVPETIFYLYIEHTLYVCSKKMHHHR